MTTRTHLVRLGLTLLVTASLTGCTATAPAVTSAVNTITSTATAAPAAPAPAAPAPPAPAAPAPAGPVAVTGTSSFLPNSARTPGATNPDVTQTTINQTICVTGWTSTIRPPSSVTTAIKKQQLASGYAYQGDTLTSHYEEDHLISLELGGSPASELNLWPEPYTSDEGARVKDRVENKLHSLVCAGTITLATAQQAIAGDWWSAYKTYVG